MPSVDVRDGRVSYRGGAGADLVPGRLAARYVAEGAEGLHLVDLEAADGGPQRSFALLASIARASGVRCRLAGGIATLDRARAAREAGFAAVLFSSAVFGDRSLLHRCARSAGAILEIESRDGRLAPRGGDAALVAAATGIPADDAASIAVLRGATDLYVRDTSAGGVGGPPLVLLEEMRVAAGGGVRFHTGGVRDLNDIRALAEWGAASAVVGRALIEGRFTLAEARAACA